MNIRTLLTASALMAGIGCAAEPPVHYSLDDHPCEMPIPAGLTADDLRCATLRTPRVRDEPDGPEVAVEIAVLRARGEATRPPLVFIGGGPGGLVLDGYLQSWAAETVAPFAGDRDVVFFDPRGTGRSAPSLHCPEVDEADLQSYLSPTTSDENRVAALAAFDACRARLVDEGVSPRGVHSAAVATDVVEMMEGLGYGRFSVYGLSYGARVALVLERDHAERIESVVLDSPVTPEAGFGSGWGAAFERALDALFAACAASERCATEHPNLEEDLFTIAARLDAEPLEIEAMIDGEPRTLYVEGHRFLNGVHSALYDAELYPLIPLAVEQSLAGHYDLLAAFAPQLIPAPGSLSHGHYASMLCAEALGFETRESVAASREGVRPELVEALEARSTDLYLEVCRTWGTELRPEIETQPVVSDIPTLLLTGGLDPATPPQWADAAAEHLSRSQSVHFPHFGHGILRTDFAQPDPPRCAQRLVRDFLADPTAPVDAGCAADIAPLL